MDPRERGALDADMSDLIRELGAKWRLVEVPATPVKFADRPTQLAKKARLVDDCLPEYKKGGRSCLDLSCGNGVLLEVLRHYGNHVLGADRAHFDFLRSQDVPYVEFDGDRLPYPFGDRSFDLVTCIGSITFYAVAWAEVLAEFCRIARRTVFVQVNQGWILDENRALLQRWTAPGWDCVMRESYRFKWERV